MDVSLSRLLFSLFLPLTAAGIIPSILISHSNPHGWQIPLPFPYVRVALAIIVTGLGLLLVVTTIRLFARIGRGTLAPWDPTRKLVTRGVYAYTRNPMISGVLFILAGEAILFRSWAVCAWAAVFFLINTAYFKLSEEPGLVKRFGQEYLTYRDNVPMWLPRLRPWRLDQDGG